MFEDKKRDVLQAEMLNDVSSDYDKTEGSFIYDATKPAAIQLEKAYESLDKVVNKLDADNLEGEDLEKFVYQRTGITRRKATYSIGSLSVTGNGAVNQGDLFETESGIQFIAVETKTISTSGTVNIQSVLPGDNGNVPANQITVIPVTLSGIVSVTNTQATSEGYEAESDSELRQRYYERIQTPATSGNKNHYKSWAKEINGVGDAKVFPLWNGDNTVKVVIIDSTKQPASALLVHDVQNYIDPGVTGSGDGVAPIGAYCTIESASGVSINVSFTAVIDSAHTLSDIQAIVEDNITSYLESIAFVQNYVSYAQIGSLILQSDGLLDYSNLKVNGGTTNVSIADNQVAVLGGVTIVQ